MQIQMSAGVVRLAAFAAVTAAGNELEEFKTKHAGDAYDQLVSRARENGYEVTSSVMMEMKLMAQRDADESAERHPAHNTLEGMKTIIAMCDYVEQAVAHRWPQSVTVDHTDFHHLQEFLPKE